MATNIAPASTEPPPNCQLTEIYQLVRDAFGEAFDMWSVDDCPRRILRAEDGWAAENNPPASDTCAEAIYRTVATNEPTLQRLPSDEYLLSIPFCRPGEIDTVATVVIADPEYDLSLGLARGVLREFRLQQRIDELQTENRQLAEQVIGDFGELSFLRYISDQLQLSNISHDLRRMAENVLPMLSQSLRAESVVLLLNESDPDSPAPQCRRALCIGEDLLDEPSCTLLVERCREAGHSFPIVKNNCSSGDEFADIPDLSGFVLTDLNHCDEVLGWLLAVNKMCRPVDGHDELSATVEHIEFGTGEATLLGSAASILATHAANVNLLNEKEQLLTNVVRALVSALEAKDQYTFGHSERVARFAQQLGEKLGLDEEACEGLYMTGLLHDIGKIGVDDSALQKPGVLTALEFEKIKAHPHSGWSILHEVEQLRYVLPGVLFHHERYDGLGYPDGLVGDEIPFVARILSVVDAFDAMTSDRPYRRGMPIERAITILRDGAGEYWDPEVVDAFIDAAPLFVAQSDRSPPRRPARRKPKTIIALDETDSGESPNAHPRAIE